MRREEPMSDFVRRISAVVAFVAAVGVYLCLATIERLEARVKALEEKVARCERTPEKR